MAINFFDCKGFGQIEPNQVWFNRAGMVEAQCALDPADFASHFPMTREEAAPTDPSEHARIYGENGAFYIVDKVNKLVKVPTEELSNRGYVMGINYSTERIYNQFTPGRRNFCMICDEFYPRLGFIEPGMRITTNTVCYDTTAEPFASMTDDDDSYRNVWAAIKDYIADPTNDPLYAVVLEGSDGKLVIGGDVESALGNVYAQVVKAYTNADGTLSFMFEFVNKPVTE